MLRLGYRLNAGGTSYATKYPEETAMIYVTEYKRWQKD